ncbi:MAG: hypothetical protein M3Y31_03935 [Gemmatimonadota bacterium]|nr:hypothetical protein [Gemmatimonadota bacterium]
MRTLLLSAAFAVVAASPAAAQDLRGLVSELFIFGEGEEALFLGGSADPDNPTGVQAHGDHYVPSAVEGNATIISFLTGSIGASIGSLPVSAASGGSTFRFEGGAPVRTSVSAGPIFGERAQTLGRGRLLAGLHRSSASFQMLRGVDLDNVDLTFTHENVDFPGCDEAFGGDCSLAGVPDFENATIDLRLRLDIDLTVTSFLMSYGLTDRIDVGVVVPLVNTSLRGQSDAQIIPFGGGPAPHFFDGTVDDPVLTASRFVDGSATGLGDVATRVKINLRESLPVAIGILAEARLPTGDEDDLLGAGSFAGRGLAIVSARFGEFSPHGNLGYLYRGGDSGTDAFIATIGFDQLLAPWATLAADVVSEFEVGDTEREVPGDVVMEAPFRRTIRTSNLPDRRDDIVNGSLGVKLTNRQGLTFIANGAWPLNRGGLRPDLFWTVGIEYNF